MNQSFSIWNNTSTMPTFPALHNDIETEVCVVGGGIAGLTTAYLLMKEGKKVCVIEDNELGSGQTSRTTAHFVTALDDRYFNLEKLHGIPGARLAAESHRKAISRVEEIVKAEHIDCDLEVIDGYLMDDSPSSDILEKELGAAHRAGLNEVHLVSKNPLASYHGPALHFPQQMQFHPLKYLRGLAECIVRDGGKIFCRTHASEIHGGTHAHVLTNVGYKINCKSIVVATNTPINNLFAIHTKQSAYRTYVIGLKIPKGSVPKGLYWDTKENYHYIRVQKNELDPDTEILIVGGGDDHRTGQSAHPDQYYSELETWVRNHFPMAKEMLYRWSGQVMEPIDGLAYLGHNPLDRNNVYVITGDSGNGMTHCTIGAILITDQIMGRPNPWEELYSPSRLNLKALRKYFQENVNMIAQYSDWLMEQQYDDLSELPPGEGALLRKGFKIIAAYKDERNNVELYSATCPHLGGVVQWNSAEKSWDCPCHGSRFDAHGKVIEGPANKNLSPVKKPDPIFTGKVTLPTKTMPSAGASI